MAYAETGHASAYLWHFDDRSEPGGLCPPCPNLGRGVRGAVGGRLLRHRPGTYQPGEQHAPRLGATSAGGVRSSLASSDQLIPEALRRGGCARPLDGRLKLAARPGHLRGLGRDAGGNRPPARTVAGPARLHRMREPAAVGLGPCDRQQVAPRRMARSIVSRSSPSTGISRAGWPGSRVRPRVVHQQLQRAQPSPDSDRDVEGARIRAPGRLRPPASARCSLLNSSSPASSLPITTTRPRVFRQAPATRSYLETRRRACPWAPPS